MFTANPPIGLWTPNFSEKCGNSLLSLYFCQSCDSRNFSTQHMWKLSWESEAVSLDWRAKWTALRRTRRLSWPVNVGKKNGQHRLSEWHKEAKKTGLDRGTTQKGFGGTGRPRMFSYLGHWPGSATKCAAKQACNSPAGPVCEYHVFPRLCAPPNPNPDLKVHAN